MYNGAVGTSGQGGEKQGNTIHTIGVRQLLLEWHPDKRRDDPDAPAVFRFLRLEVEKAPPLAGEAGSEAVGGSEAEWVELDEGGAPSAPSPLPPSLPTFYSAAFATQRAARKSTDESLALASLLKEAVFPVPAPPNGSEGERARMLAHVRELLCGWIDSTLPRAMSVLGLIEAEAATTPSANLAVPSPSTASPLRPVTPTRTPASTQT
ncbi:hypothetical protein T492DRAFT_1147459 [Pavlovales sp. CCMP2436]|nr:hypothetical protein T492DRAFT_1147459 [Pavlovales sp. CCMP2436]